MKSTEAEGVGGEEWKHKRKEKKEKQKTMNLLE